MGCYSVGYNPIRMHNISQELIMFMSMGQVCTLIYRCRSAYNKYAPLLSGVKLTQYRRTLSSIDKPTFVSLR